MRERERRYDGDAPESLKTEIVPFERDLLSSPRQGREEEELPPPATPPAAGTARSSSSFRQWKRVAPSHRGERSFVKRAECDAARVGEGGEGDLPGRFLWRELRCLHAKACNDVFTWGGGGGTTMNEKQCRQNGVNYSGYLKRPLKQRHCRKAHKG